ncbi:hypothetical protein DPMN_044993 [Dreissena polymorpha]|uniref:C2H2-type domain-containing protein n=1 Tax=Dreissena polymorpha TaxID=45954 RepID=A0A9D4D555_DREPO|nr:hypothetical protein DPMN_044993 [Dreissena polymorpha]
MPTTFADIEPAHMMGQRIMFALRVAFADKYLLRAHEQTETREGYVTCSICNKQLRDDACLREHMATHSNRKDNLCNKCGKHYKHISSLCRHQKRCN